MTTIETSVDARVAELEARKAELEAELAQAQAEREREAEAQRRERFSEMVGGFEDVTKALGIDWGTLDELGIVGFELVQESDGVKRVTPIARKASRSASPSGEKRDLTGCFEAHATAEEKRELASINALTDASKKNNASYQLKLKVWKRVNK